MRAYALILFFLAGSASATSLVNRSQFLSADSLPDGVWTFGLAEGREVDSRQRSFSADGTSVTNSEFFSKRVTYANLLDETNTPLERELARAAFEVYNRNLSDVAGSVVNDVDISQSSRTFVFGRGFGERTSFFVILPLVTLKTRFESRFVPSASLDTLSADLRAEGLPQQSDAILEKSRNALLTRLEETRYRTEYPSELTTLANIHLNHRTLALRGPRANVAVDSTLVVPAGKKFDENDFLRLRLNEEQFSLRESVTGSYRHFGRLALLGSGYFQKRFPFTRPERIPYNSTSPISADIDASTRVQYGDTWGLSAQANFLATDTFSVYLGRSYEEKFRDRYSGSAFPPERYGYLEQDSAQNLTLNYVGLTLNSIPAFLAGRFPVPLDLNLQYSFTSAGKNTFDQKVVAMTIMVFYK